MEFDREELLAVLTDASPALARVVDTNSAQARTPTTVPGLDHFWFDSGHVHAYNGALGVRITFKSGLDCGLPGKALLDLLKTSALKQVSIELGEKDVTIKMGKSRVKLASLDPDRFAWPKEWVPSRKDKSDAHGTLTLSEDVLEAITRVSFVRFNGKPTWVVHNGIAVIPHKDALEFYSTDSASMARTAVKSRPPKDLPRFVAPWGFVDMFLGLVEPGAPLHVMGSYLIVEGKGVLICSNLLRWSDEPNLPETMAVHIRDEDDPVVEIPAGLQAALDRAMILSGNDETPVKFSTDGKLLILEGKYKLGSLDEELPLKTKVADSSALFKAHVVRRGLGKAKHFLLSNKSLVFDDGADFIYTMARHYEPGSGARRVKDDGDEDAPKRKPVARRKAADDEDEVPF